MARDGIRAAASAALLFAAVACGTSGDSNPPAAITQVSGNSQAAAAGSQLANPLIVLVTSSNQTPVVNATVNWAVTSGSGTVTPVSSVTDANGQAQATLTLGVSATSVSVTATVAGTALSTVFSESAVTGVGNCFTPTVGSVTLSVQATGVCLQGGGGGGDYALISFNASTNPENQASVTVTGSNVQALSTPDIRPSGLTPVSLSGGLAATAALRYAGHARLEARLRPSEELAVRPRIASAREWMRSRSSGTALRDPIPATVHVGDLLRLNANSNDACTNPDIRIGRVAAISNAAIVVADTANPPGGFTDADYASFGAQFDTLVNPLDTANFGAPTDIDKNGRELIFFTRAVNELTPPKSGEIIGGFFIPRDLLPQTSTSTIQGCATSNVGEMFYMQVPDPNGVVNNNVFTVAQVEQYTVATLAHEYQHLINAARRIYINNASDLEEVWLNEGLSHIAEELLFYKVSGLTPRQNLDLSTLQGQTKFVDAFNNYELANAGRYQDYLSSPNTSSVYADDDSLKDRGAIWGFLRWAADHKGTADDGTWRALVNSSTTGLANLTNVFGADLLLQIRDYSTSVFADDVPSVTEPRALQPSWNWRSIYPAITSPSRYPLTVLALASGTPRSITVRGGGSAYYRFTVGAGATATITWTTSTGTNVNWALVRSR